MERSASVAEWEDEGPRGRFSDLSTFTDVAGGRAARPARPLILPLRSASLHYAGPSFSHEGRWGFAHA